MPVGTGNDGYRIPDAQEGSSSNKIEMLPGEDDEHCRTFVIHGEDHTLGNALKHIIIQNPDVQFAGYTVPHPMDGKIHIRIQTYKGKSPSVHVLRSAIEELKKQNQKVLKMIQDEVGRYSSEDR